NAPRAGDEEVASPGAKLARCLEIGAPAVDARADDEVILPSPDFVGAGQLCRGPVGVSAGPGATEGPPTLPLRIEVGMPPPFSGLSPRQRIVGSKSHSSTSLVLPSTCFWRKPR